MAQGRGCPLVHVDHAERVVGKRAEQDGTRPGVNRGPARRRATRAGLRLASRPIPASSQRALKCTCHRKTLSAMRAAAQRGASPSPELSAACRFALPERRLTDAEEPVDGRARAWPLPLATLVPVTGRAQPAAAKRLSQPMQSALQSDASEHACTAASVKFLSVTSSKRVTFRFRKSSKRVTFT